MSREFEAAVVAEARACGPSGRRFRRVDHFIQIGGWTTSRKTLLLCAVLLPFQILGGVAAHVRLGDSGILDMRYSDVIA